MSTTIAVKPVAETEPMPDVPVGSPLWLVYDIEREMEARNQLIQLYEDYYESRHKALYVTSKFRETFGQMLAAVNDNWMPLIVRASVERLGVQGIELRDDKEGTDLAWDTWQRNHLDEDAPLLFTESAKHGEAYTLTWADHRPSSGVFGRLFARRSRDLQPLITVEHPAQMLVRREAGDRRRVAVAMKRWQEGDGTLMATLYLPDRIFRWRRNPGLKEKWVPRELDGIPAEETNPLDEVPVTPIVNDPHMLPCYPPKSMLCAPHLVPNVAVGFGRSDLADFIATQDHINLLLCHFLVNSEYRSFIQRWATGLEIPTDENGQPVETYKAAVDRLWTSKDPASRFGTFAQDDPKPILEGIDQRIMSLASRSRTPAHYLPRPTGQYPSGESLKAAETGLSAKVNDKQTSHGGGLKDTTRLAFLVTGDEERAAAPIEISWRSSESRSESEFVDSLVKKLAIGVPKEQLWVDYGYSPQQIANFQTMLKEAARTAGLTMGFPDPAKTGLPDEPPAPPVPPNGG